jgi:purine-binding chemotaxis protein CheW
MIIGLLVESVTEVLTISREDVQPVPEILGLQERGNYLSGMAKVGDRMITLLDLEKILTSEELSRLAGMRP